MKPIGIAAAAAAVLALLFWSRKSSAEPVPEPVPEPPKPEPPKPGPGQRGDDPLDDPTQGHWYRVKDGDNLSRIASLADLGGTSWRLIRDAAENSWLPQMYLDGRFFAGTSERALPLYRWFASPGYKVDPQWKTAADHVFPSVFIPVKK